MVYTVPAHMGTSVGALQRARALANPAVAPEHHPANAPM